MLLVAVNSNLESPYGIEVKFWLIGMSLILALGSLISLVSILKGKLDQYEKFMRFAS